MASARTTLVIGGARCGKTAYGEACAQSAKLEKIYIATAQSRDEEMEARIAQHRQMRGEGWQTIEEPLDIAKIISGAQAGHVLLVDCLTLWLSNLMENNCDIGAETKKLIAALTKTPAKILFITNEVGLGIVPENALGRQFRDYAGKLNQDIASTCEEVIFIAAGLPLVMKGQKNGG